MIALFGVSALALLHWNPGGYFDGIEKAVAPIVLIRVVAVLMVLWGGVVLFVSACSYLIGKFTEKLAIHRQQKQILSDIANTNSLIAENLSTLSTEERDQLVWIIRAGSQRFVQFWTHPGLKRKEIVSVVPNKESGTYEVTEPVWRNKDALMEMWSAVPKQKRFPGIDLKPFDLGDMFKT